MYLDKSIRQNKFIREKTINTMQIQKYKIIFLAVIKVFNSYFYAAGQIIIQLIDEIFNDSAFFKYGCFQSS